MNFYDWDRLPKFDDQIPQRMNIHSFLLLLAACFLPLAITAQETNQKITLENIWIENTFSPDMVRGMNPLKNGRDFAVIEDTALNVFSYETGEYLKTLQHKNDLIPDGDENPIPFRSYTLSPDESKMLIPTQTERIYRHSSRSYFYIYDLETKQLKPLSENGKQRLATFSPDGNKIAFVRENNLFITDLKQGTEQRITTDGVLNEIINGTTDWVYEEEFSFTKAFFWSPDSRKIAFYRFDESGVNEWQMEFFSGLYPEWYRYRYPKAGEDNALVSLHVYQLDDESTIDIDLESGQTLYYPRIKWTQNADILSVQQLNRHQNHLKIWLAHADNGHVNLLYEEENEYYIDITNDLTFLPDDQHFIISSEKDGYNHLYLYDMDGIMIKQLTQGNWDVTHVYGYDTIRQLLYFQSAEISPLERQVYHVSLTGEKRQLSFMPGVNHAGFSTGFQYFMQTNTTVKTPPYITINRADGEELRVLKDNQALQEKLSEYGLAPVEFFEITDPEIVLPDGETVSLNAYKIFPPDFDPNKKYPVLIYVYGGPGSQTVMNAWGWSNFLWFQMLAQQGIIVVSVDNRGTGARGETFKKMTYLQLGKYETEDMMSTARFLAKYDYVDAERIGIFGWSYGGYVSSLAITKGADYFKSAIAVAPVTSWRFYDNIYTERYMRTPQENPDGYDDNSPINFVDKLKGDYLLVHGSADDNVHYQNTMEMIKALVEADKQFELMIYPDLNHGIRGGNARYHLFTLMTDFLKRTLFDD